VPWYIVFILARMKSKKALPPYEKVSFYFSECANSPSGLIWKNPTSLKIKPGDQAGSLKSHGYWVVRINKTDYYVHRLIYLLRTKTDPGNLEVDHASNNGIKDNNSVLRLATRSENAANTNKKTYKQKTQSKWKGVYKKRKKWAAQAWADGKKYHLGSFGTEKEAALAYNVFAKEHFGIYAVLNTVLV